MTDALYKGKKFFESLKHKVLNLSEVEIEVMEATNDDKWGPSGTQLNQIAKHTYHQSEYREVMGILWKRLASDSKEWRTVYKSLNVIEHLIRTGSDRVVADVRDHIYELRTLKSFEYIDDENVDRGINVRERAKKLINFVNSDEQIKFERESAARNRGKYGGFSREEMSGGGAGGGVYDGFSSNDYNQGYYGAKSSATTEATGHTEGGNRDASESESSSDSESDSEEEVKPKKLEVNIKSTKQAPQSDDLLGLDFGAPKPKTDSNNAFDAPKWAAFDSDSKKPAAATADAFDFNPRAEKKPSAKPTGGFDDNWDAFGDFSAPPPAPVQKQQPKPKSPIGFEADFGDFSAAPPAAPTNQPNQQPLAPAPALEPMKPQPIAEQTKSKDVWAKAAHMFDLTNLKLGEAKKEEKKQDQQLPPAVAASYAPLQQLYGSGLRPQAAPVMPMGPSPGSGRPAMANVVNTAMGRGMPYGGNPTYGLFSNQGQPKQEPNNNLW